MQGQVSLEWGLTGALSHPTPDFAVVVDVLSFTTTVAVAAERGIEVYPFPEDSADAQAYAETVGAVLAGGRSQAGSVSLSPASMMRTTETKVVLPSPNGSTISAALGNTGTTVVAASLRNASAVAVWLASRIRSGSTVMVVASGERWPDHSLRPAVEDLWGAGAVIHRLQDAGLEHLTPDARAAEAAFRDAHIRDQMTECASGRELLAKGFARDLEIAGRVDASGVVPVLHDDRFIAVRG